MLNRIRRVMPTLLLWPALLPVMILIICVICSTASVFADQAADDFFENQIRPVLVESCFRCHGDSRESGLLRVDSRESLTKGGESGAAIVPGKPEDSLLIRAIQRQPDVSAMPPENDKALRPDQIAAFEKWIREGAVWPARTAKFEGQKHWAFQPVRDVEVPSVDDPVWSKNPVDAFIRSKQAALGVHPGVIADKRTLIRRVTFDLIGLPPSPDEVSAFENDASPTAFEKVVDRLLSSPHYGERWGRHWLDVVRYADTAGETADYPVPLAWRYRNYVIDALNADLPYDQFLREQIAGDVLANQTVSDRYAQQVAATGYLAISRRFGFDSENYHHLTIQDTIDTLGLSVLGLSLGCARCHDHKFDPVSMTDYYGLYGIFDSSRYAFPGSEQKQKFRSMVPLIPPTESTRKWREFDQRVATLAARLEKQDQSVPTVVLRSLNDADGDFEMQAPAAGGSNGVLVPPWLYEGNVAITNAAQSPFRNLYGRGRVGASIATGTDSYRISQSMYPRRTAETSPIVFVNLDFRVGNATANLNGAHQLRLGAFSDSPAVIVQISSKAIHLRIDDESASRSERVIASVLPGHWHNLQLALDLSNRTVSGVVSCQTGEEVLTTPFSAAPLSSRWGGIIDFVELSSFDRSIVAQSDDVQSDGFPGIEFDNLGIQDEPIPVASTDLAGAAEDSREEDTETLLQRLQTLIGLGGDFELQTVETAPESPWNPGPNSVVRIAHRAQSPFRNTFADGSQGVHMPNRAEYDGFGLTLPQAWTANDTDILFSCFDFRVADTAAGGNGSWRFYVGHGPGNSAAVELYLNGSQFFRRSGDARDTVGPLTAGEWYQVQLRLHLKTRSYHGTLTSKTSRVEFSGDVSSGWDGTIDYSFIDSYGHLGGVRPALDVDNYDISTTPHPPFEAVLTETQSSGSQQRRAEAEHIREQLNAAKERTRRTAEELNRLLVDGPFPMAYGMAEGTPHNVRVQRRGEPSQPGDVAPRGFVRAIGGGVLPETASGSGRLELANWLTNPENPLTSRVMANRIWQYHFGFGIVRTPNDFGVRGLPPSHPELLDYLATQFVRSGWSLKAMHRLIVLSRTYKLSSFSDMTTDETSGLMNSSDLYTHFSRRRLSAEEIRDSILTVSGELDRTQGLAHPFPSPLTWGFSQHGPFSAVYDHNRRSVYLMTQRLKRHPFLALFDGPDPNASTADRLRTTVPTQALFFLNDPFVHAHAEAWAQRLLERGHDDTQRVEQAWLQGFGRKPTAEELQGAIEFLSAYRKELTSSGMDRIEQRSLTALLRTLIGSNEFLHVD